MSRHEKKALAANCLGMSSKGGVMMSAVRKITIPEGVKAQLDGMQLRITGPKGQLSRNVRFPQVVVTCDGKEITISTDSKRKEINAMVGTLEAHSKNMFRGVTEGFEYRMKVVFSHFPIQLKLQGNKLEIANFLGEKKARYARIEAGVTAKVANDEVVLTGIDRELVGTSAANIEHATHIRDRDPRVFQDGIYMVQRG
jgi:large subunit ribosomal protein L6